MSQTSSLHAKAWATVPAQPTPPFFAGVKINRSRDCTPPPQVFEQGVQASHSPSTQFTLIPTAWQAGSSLHGATSASAPLHGVPPFAA
jgi:hypothetical protein